MHVRNAVLRQGVGGPTNRVADHGFELAFELHGVPSADARRQAIQLLRATRSEPGTLLFCNTVGTACTLASIAGKILRVGISTGEEEPAQMIIKRRAKCPLLVTEDAAAGVIVVEATCVLEKDPRAPEGRPLNGSRNCNRVGKRDGVGTRYTIRVELAEGGGQGGGSPPPQAAVVEFAVFKPQDIFAAGCRRPAAGANAAAAASRKRSSPSSGTVAQLVARKDRPKAGGALEDGGSGAPTCTPGRRPRTDEVGTQRPSGSVPPQLGLPSVSCPPLPELLGGGGTATGLSAAAAGPGTDAAADAEMLSFMGRLNAEAEEEAAVAAQSCGSGAAAAAALALPRTPDPGQRAQRDAYEHEEGLRGLDLMAVRAMAREEQIAVLTRIQDLMDPARFEDSNRLRIVLERLHSNQQLRSLSCPLALLRGRPVIAAALSSLPLPSQPGHRVVN